MRKEDKALIIDNIKDTLGQYACFYLTSTQGLDAARTSELRRACFKADIKMLCVKNTLLRKAMEQCDTDYSELYELLKGETTLLLSNTGNAPARLIKDFRQKKETLPALKGAYVEDRICRRGSARDSGTHQEQERTYRRYRGTAAITGQERYQRTSEWRQQASRHSGNLIKKRRSLTNPSLKTIKSL